MRIDVTIKSYTRYKFELVEGTRVQSDDEFESEHDVREAVKDVLRDAIADYVDRIDIEEE